MSGFWWVTKRPIRAIFLTVSTVGTIIWFTGISLGIGGAEDSSSDHIFHFPFPCEQVSFLVFKLVQYLQIYDKTTGIPKHSRFDEHMYTLKTGVVNCDNFWLSQQHLKSFKQLNDRYIILNQLDNHTEHLLVVNTFLRMLQAKWNCHYLCKYRVFQNE